MIEKPTRRTVLGALGQGKGRGQAAGADPHPQLPGARSGPFPSRLSPRKARTRSLAPSISPSLPSSALTGIRTPLVLFET